MAPNNDIQGVLAEEITKYAHDPLGFALFAFPWGETGTPLAKSTGPRQWQADLLNSLGKRLRAGYSFEAELMPVLQAVASGHGIGKSAFISMLLAWGMSTCADCRCAVTANTELQLRTKLFPEITKWFRLLINSHWFRVNGLSVHSAIPGHSKLWRCDAVTWSEKNTEAFAGLHNEGKRIIAIFDEASAIPASVWEVTEGALTDENTEIIWAVLGNPTQPQGRFFECFNRQRDRWNPVRIDSRSVEGTNKKLFAGWADTYGEDSDFMRVRVKGEFPRVGSMQFIGTDVIEAACRREVAADLTDALIMGVDVARYGDDQSVIFFRKGRDARIIPPIFLRKTDTMTLAARVVEEAQHHGADAVFIDGGGVGGGVVDRCRQLHLRGLVEVQFGGKPDRADFGTNGMKFANKRAEIWGNMREWLKTGAIPDNQELRTDLTGPYYFFNANNEIFLESKDVMKKRGFASPDIADALALTFAWPVMNSTATRGPMGVNQQPQIYNPWE